MQQAPFASDEVLETISVKETGWSKGMIRNVLRTHPQAAKSTVIQENLDNRTNQLPQFMRNQINQGLTIISEKEQMEIDAASHRRTRNRAIREALRLLSSDTYNRTADMIEFLSNTGELGFEYRLAEIYDARNETQLADNILNGIGTWELSEKSVSDYADYMSFRTLMWEWEAVDKNLTELGESDMDLLRKYANQPNITSTKAIALLELNGISEYIERVYFPKIEETAQIADDSQDNNDNVLLIYPNPAKEYITLRHSMMEAFEDATITVTDIMGKTVYQQNITEKQNELVIHIGQLPQGQYFCTLKSDHIMVNQKFLLIH